MSDISYKQQNLGCITASKLKTFIKSPEAYYLEYIKEVEIEREDKKAFIIGTAFDDFLSYWPIFFHEKYYVDHGYTISELTEKLLEQWKELTGKEKKDELLKCFYWDVENKVKLTKADFENIEKMVWEASRQPLWDITGEYEHQVVIECLYRGKMKLRGRLDRLSLEKKLIRDYKTTANLKNFSFDLSSKFGYETSMAFYHILVKIVHWVDCDVILDVVQSWGKHQSEVFCYQKERMEREASETIIPALDRVLALTEEFEKTGDESIWVERPQNRYELFELDTYPLLESGKQTLITYL